MLTVKQLVSLVTSWRKIDNFLQGRVPDTSPTLTLDTHSNSTLGQIIHQRAKDPEWCKDLAMIILDHHTKLAAFAEAPVVVGQAKGTPQVHRGEDRHPRRA